MVAISFDATQIQPSTGSQDVFETGEYSFQIVGSSTKATKKGDGTMLVLDLSCLDEGFAGRRLTVRLNLHNPSQDAVRIAQQEFSAICHVVGMLQITDTQQLHGRPFRVRVEKVPRSDDPTKFNNNVLGYLDMEGNPPGQQSGGAPSAPQAPQQPAAPQAPAAPAQPQQPAPSAPPAAPAAPMQQAPAPSAPPAAPSAPPAAPGAPPWNAQQASAPAAPTGAPPWMPQQ